MIKNKIIEYKKKSNIDDEKIVNYNCFCSNRFNCVEKILYILPCCHIVHEICFNNYILKLQYKKLNFNNVNNSNELHLDCPFCKNKIEKILTEYKINSKKKYNQYKIDIHSIRLDNSAVINYMLLPLSIVKFTSIMNKLINASTEEDLISLIENVILSFNIKINMFQNIYKSLQLVLLSWQNNYL